MQQRATITEQNRPALPRHVAIIMDGNGRWAAQRGLLRSEGHRAGVDAFERICEHAADLGIAHLTFYAFSAENWARPQGEVDALMALFRRQLSEAKRRRVENEQKRWRIRYIGDLQPGGLLPADILALVDEMQAESSMQDKTVVNLAINYGGQQEILQAVKQLAQACATGERDPASLTEQDIEAQLYTAGQPPPDLIIRPSGEQRLSNFLLWQSAYAEFWFSDILWPDFSTADFDQALADYAKRNRRYGGA
ncbi:MAG: polyprenyl diphosphate synthase [Oscillospiraceae bacterium]|nr:polyprenyl diphosphate synthase [Oscillospiraceae bacterium]